MVIILYILANYVLFMCLWKDEITQIQHLFVVLSFALITIVLMMYEPYIAMYINGEKPKVDILTGLVAFVSNDYKRSNARKIIIHIRKNIKYFLSKCKNDNNPEA